MVEFKHEAIPGYTGKYDIYSDGRVWSNYCKGRWLKPGLSIYGYLLVSLYLNGKTKSFVVHTLVAKHFVKGYKKGLQINHINGNKTDNHFENLEWCTAKENTRHAYDTGLRNDKGSKSVHSKLTERYIPVIRNRCSSGDPIRDIAKDYGVSCAVIFNVRRGKTWKHV